MPINLSGAYTAPRAPQAPTPKLDLQEGTYNAIWLGQSDPFDTYNNFEGCSGCGDPDLANPGKFKKGSGTIAATGQKCSQCSGTGLRVQEQVRLEYEMANGKVISESVNFKLSPPSQTPQGRVFSASKLYTRYRSFSGLTEPKEIMEWSMKLPDEPRIPVTIMVALNQTGKSVRIANVIRRQVEEAPVLFTPKIGKADEIPF